MIIKIAQENANRRLDKFLFAHLNNAPHSFIYKMLRKKRIKLNGGRAHGNELLQEGDELRFFLSEETIEGCRKPRSFAPAEPLTDIIFEDESLLVVNKPAGLPSQGGNQLVAKRDQLIARILYYLQEKGTYDKNADFVPALCNRLDVNTSGLVVCGKNLRTLQEVNALFAAQKMEKEYLAVAEGIVGKVGESHVLEGFYEKDTKANTAKITKTQGKQQVTTAYTVSAISKDKKHTLLKINPITGRSHQIRAHLASIGHPLAGDKKYGGSSSKSTPYAPAQLLHCRKLNQWEAPPPEGFIRCVQKWFNVFLY